MALAMEAKLKKARSRTSGVGGDKGVDQSEEGASETTF